MELVIRPYRSETRVAHGFAGFMFFYDFLWSLENVLGVGGQVSDRFSSLTFTLGQSGVTGITLYSRCLVGLLNGNIGVMKSMVAGSSHFTSRLTAHYDPNAEE